MKFGLDMKNIKHIVIKKDRWEITKDISFCCLLGMFQKQNPLATLTTTALTLALRASMEFVLPPLKGSDLAANDGIQRPHFGQV